jgi:hypothetical protein
MDNKLTWKQHVVKKRKQIDLTIKQMNWLIDRKSKIAVENKILIYKAIIVPVDVRPGIMGLRKQIQYINNPKKPI